MLRAVNPGVFSLRFNSEGIEQAVIVVLETFTGMSRNIQLVSAFNKIKTLDKKFDFTSPCQFNWLVLFNVGVRSVTTHTFCVKNTYAKHKILNRLCRTNLKLDNKLVPTMKNMCFVVLPTVDLHIHISEI